MEKSKLMWTETGRKQIADCKILTVSESYCKPPEARVNQNDTHTFTVIDSKDWCIVIPVTKDRRFVMVWQWRHGAKAISLEFPGGVMEDGETPEAAAARELREETGYIAGKLTKLGEFSTNPALMTNTAHIFLAEDLTNSGNQKLDDNEFVEVELVGEKEVIKGMGKEPYIHALMGTALSLYLARDV